MKNTKYHFLRCTSILLCIVMLFVFMPQAILAEGQLTAIGDTERYGISKSYEVENESEIESSESSIDDEALQRELKNDPLFAAEGSSVLKYVDNAEFAKGNHIQRIKSEEDLNTYVFRNDDGSKSVYILDENVKYVDAEGQTCEKDITLVEKENGFGVASNEYELLLPYTVSEGIVFAFKGHQIKMLPQGGNEKCISELEDNSIIYHNYYGEGLSLKYTPTLGGIKEEIVLEKISIIEYTFVVETDGLYICDIDGRYFLSESKDTYTEKESLLCLSDIIVFDAVGRQCLGSMCIITQTEGEKYIVTIAADENFLRDKETVYPVTIDPTIQDTASASNLIEDTPVFSGYPNSNFYNYVYLTAGYTDNTYKIGRIAIRLPGLMDYLTQNLIGINDINSVLFRVRDSSGHGNQAVHIYPIEQSWTETTATWNGIGTYINTSSDWGGTMGTDTSFDITSLVRGWLAPVYNYESGFMIVNDNESSASYKKAPFSSEYSTESYRPYVLLCYSRPTTGMISLNASAKTIALNSTSTLTATTSPSNMTVTWSSSNTGVATVTPSGTYNQQCTINASHAGTTAIRAACTNSDGITEYAECTVYVYTPDGVYYIKNYNSGRYLSMSSNIEENYDAYQYSMFSGPDTNKIRQMWYIHHLGSGKYTIRPYYRRSRYLYAYGTAVKTCESSTTTNAMKWQLEWISGSYIIKNCQNSNNTMRIENGSTAEGANAVVGYYNSSSRWVLTKVSSPPSGVYLYDRVNSCVITTPTKYIDPGTTSSLMNLDLIAVPYTTYTDNQNMSSWTSSNTSVATVNSNGDVTGVSPGTVTITAKKYCGSTVGYKTASYTLIVNTLSSGEYFIENRHYEEFVQIDDNDAPSYNNNGGIIEIWPFDGGEYQKWVFTHVGDGYYKISSKKNGFAITVPQGNETTDNVDLILSPYTGLDRQKWTIELTSHGSYKIKAKSSINYTSKDLVMDMEMDPFYTDGLNVRQREYVDNETYRDEWHLAHSIADTNVPLEGQKKSNWCWAAASRMFSKNYFPSVSHTQNNAVVAIKGSEVNDSGTINEAINAIDYYISSIDGASIDKIGYYHEVYSEASLCQFLEDGHVLYISRGWYTDITDSNSRDGGHATLIYGYVTMYEQVWFLVRDPWPVDEGETYLMSYQKLVNGRNPRNGESSDTGVWDNGIAHVTSYSNDRTDYFFD